MAICSMCFGDFCEFFPSPYFKDVLSAICLSAKDFVFYLIRVSVAFWFKPKISTSLCFRCQVWLKWKSITKVSSEVYIQMQNQCCPLSVFPACQIHTYTVKHSQASLRWLFTHKGPDVAYETEETALRWVAAAFTAKGNHTRRYQKWKIWSCVM